MQKLIFFSTRVELGKVEGVNFLDVDSSERPKLLRDFEEGKVETLLLPITVCTGWYLNKLPKDLEVSFMNCSTTYYIPHRVSAFNRIQGTRHAQLKAQLVEQRL